MGSGRDPMLLMDVELMFEKCDWSSAEADGGKRKFSRAIK